MKKRYKGRALKGTNGHEKEAQRQGAEGDKWSGGKLTHLYGRHIRTLHGHEKEAQRQGAEGTNGLVGKDAFVRETHMYTTPASLQEPLCSDLCF